MDNPLGKKDLLLSLHGGIVCARGEIAMMKSGKKWGRSSLLISLAIHGAIFIFLGLYVIGTSTKVKEFVSTILVPEQRPAKVRPRPRPAIPITRPSLPRAQVVDANAIPVTTSERLSPAPGRTMKTTALPRTSDDSLAQNVASRPPLTRDRIAPRAMTTARILPSDSSLPSSVSGGASGLAGPGDGLGSGDGAGAGGGRSWTGSGMIKITPRRQPLSLTRAALKVEVDPAEVAKQVRLGPSNVPPLPKGEPGGVVVGRGKNIEGHLRFTRIKHHLADWWADPTSLPAVVRWMNNQTNIRADMNIEGGAITLDNPKLIRCPLAVMTGHDRVLLGQIGGNFRHRLADSERAGLRKYLIEAGGLLFFDECGHDLTLANMVKAELRAAIPEHSLEFIPNDHRLYTCYYDLGGPPLGAYIFWKHGHRRGLLKQVVGKHLRGLFIDDRLAVIISYRDYLCAARTKPRPGHGNTGEVSPAVYRFLTNLIVYSLTHGGISEHSDYVPEMTDADRISIDSPVQVPALPLE